MSVTIQSDGNANKAVPKICLSTLSFNQIIGRDRPERITGPIKVRGTDPGKTK